MTIGKLFLTLLMAAAIAFAFFVWPTPYTKMQETRADGVVQQLRVNRWTNGVEIQHETGEWVDHRPAPGIYDPVEAMVKDAVGSANQAGEDIRKMNEVAQDAIDKATAR